MFVIMEQTIGGHLIYEFFNRLSEETVNAEEDENMLQLQIDRAGDDLGIKVRWFNLVSVVLYGHRSVADFRADGMFLYLCSNLDTTQWCAITGINIQYSIKCKASTTQRILRHDLMICNLPRNDSYVGLLSDSGLM